ncbi:MAG: ABC transporter permease [Oscillospiraceae bacterium]|nr:ABC transporter permease [Eubacteriales bacterium]MDY2617620.1 ABC transporter permease [Oscillospiraceae bacterium]
MKRKNSVFARVCMILALIFMYAPILVLIIFSFNDSKSRTVWTGFSFHWYADLFSDTRILKSLATTLEVSVIAMIVATILGTMAAIGFASMRRKPRSVVMAINNIPMTNADIVTGVSLMMLFVFAFGAFNATLGKVFGITLRTGFGTLLLAHITFDIPYVILSIMPKFNQLDPNLYEAALDLGASPWQAFRKVVLPELMPGILSGAMLSFTMSVDDFVISYFTAGSGASTLAMEIYAMTRKRISPEINALSTLIFAVVLITLIAVNIHSAHQERVQRKKELAWKQGS